MSEIALKRIREAKENRSVSIDLSGCGLTELPDELFELTWLEELVCMGLGSSKQSNQLLKISTKIESLKKLKLLNLSGNHELSDFSAISTLFNLKVIDLSYTQIQDLSPLENLSELKELNVNRTNVDNLNSIAKLFQLKILGISYLDIKDLSPLKNLKRLKDIDLIGANSNNLISISNFIQLEELNISSAKITTISPIKKLVNLKVLWMYNTPVNDISIVGDFKKLEQLSIGNTNVKDLTFLENLKNLKEIVLSENTNILDFSPLSNLINSEEIDIRNSNISNLIPLSNLKKLKSINLSGTKVQNLTPLKNLIQNGMLVKWSSYSSQSIAVEDCPLVTPPKEIVQKGPQAVLNFFNQIDEQDGTVELYEAKMIIVGEGETGKTTLFEKMQDPNHPVGNTPETHGIKVLEGLEIRHPDIGDRVFHANLWDFGGQELQYMTHQFFLTPRAFYVLMMDARKESPNLSYWFKIISLLGKESQESKEKVPLLLVFNKKEGSTGMPQYQGFLDYYKEHLEEEFLEVDFAVNDKRFENLMERIQTRLVNLPIVKSQLPKQWKPIREALRKEKKPWITTARYDEICSKHRITKESQQWQLSNYLHQLGSILHFQNDENLMDTVILSPEWAVDGVYAILKAKKIRIDQCGRFTKQDIFDILLKNDPDRKWQYKRGDAQKILQLMAINNFDICYRTSTGTYIAPQHLPDNPPEKYRWFNDHQERALEFRFQYPIMPKGLISRLIVRLSKYIEQVDKTDIVWKKGVILNISKDGDLCRLLLKEDDAESQEGIRQLIIQVMGKIESRKYALQKVRDEVEELHKKWFRSIRAAEIIPCCCEDCRDAPKPETYSLKSLLKLRGNDSRKQCNTGNYVPIQTLLEGIYAEEEIRDFDREQQLSGRYAKESLHVDFNPVIHIENKPTNRNVVNHQAFSTEQLEAVKAVLAQLGDAKKERLQEFVEMLPEPETAAERVSTGKQIGKWLNKNAEGIVMNVSSSVYYEVMKTLFGF